LQKQADLIIFVHEFAEKEDRPTVFNREIINSPTV